MTGIAREQLQGRWVHSHEEDSEEEMVFRPADFDFPPSRGRLSFELRADGTLVERGLGPTDIPEETGGRWEIDENDRLVLDRSSSAEKERVLHVVSVEKDRLVIRK